MRSNLHLMKFQKEITLRMRKKQYFKILFHNTERYQLTDEGSPTNSSKILQGERDSATPRQSKTTKLQSVRTAGKSVRTAREKR